jgi:hypothetical protein
VNAHFIELLSPGIATEKQQRCPKHKKFKKIIEGAKENYYMSLNAVCEGLLRSYSKQVEAESGEKVMRTPSFIN